MTSSIFALYSQGENRVTATTFAVFERIGIGLTTEILEQACGVSDEFTAVQFVNQPNTGKKSTPDAQIRGDFNWVFETKTVRGVYDSEGAGTAQLRNHAAGIEGDAATRLFVLTPDKEQPPWFDSLDRETSKVLAERTTWLSFLGISTAIVDIIGDPHRVLGEQARFLLSELQQFYSDSGLLDFGADTVVVAAKLAWPIWQRYSAYICQPERFFRPDSEYLGFYYGGAIQVRVAKRLAWYPKVEITRDEVARRREIGDTELANLVDRVLDDEAQPEGSVNGVMLLSSFDDERTVCLPNPIANDSKSASGRNTAWTMGQRYANLDQLKAAKVTSDLEK